jgi:hypothetical protein
MSPNRQPPPHPHRVGRSWQHHGSLSANLFSHPAANPQTRRLLDTVITAAGHPSWLTALSRRPNLDTNTWDTLWHHNTPALRSGLCARPLTRHQLERVLSFADRAAGSPATGHSQDSAADAATAAAHNPHLLDRATLTTLARCGETAAAAVTAAATEGTLTVTEHNVDLVDDAAVTAGPLARARVAAAWAEQYPLDRLETIVVTAATIHRQRTSSQLATFEVLAHVCLGRRDDLTHLIHDRLQRNTYPAEIAVTLATQLAAVERARTGTPAHITQQGHAPLLLAATPASSQSEETQGPGGPGAPALDAASAAYLCRRLHTPASIQSYGRRLTGVDHCRQPDCWWAGSPTGEDSADTAGSKWITVGQLRHHLADVEHAAVQPISHTTTPVVGVAGAAGSVRPDRHVGAAIDTLLDAAADHLGSTVTAWELLCWLIDTVDADTLLVDLVELADSI